MREVRQLGHEQVALGFCRGQGLELPGLRFLLFSADLRRLLRRLVPDAYGMMALAIAGVPDQGAICGYSMASGGSVLL